MTLISKRLPLLLAILAIGAGLVASCVPVPPARSTTLALATSEIAQATVTPSQKTAVTNTPLPTRTVTATPTKAPTPTPTPDPHLIVITEDDITKAMGAGAGAQQGATMQNLKVRFADGKTLITADSVGYGFIQVQNLDLVGRLVASDGALGLTVESISPGGLAAGLIPSVANQALAQYASQWYVEEVRTLDGRIELRIR